MSSKYILSAGTGLKMSKEEVKDTTGKQKDGLTPVTWVDLRCTTKTIEYGGINTDEIEVTTLCSEGFKEFALGLSDPGTMSFDGHYVPEDEGQQEIIKAAEDKMPRLFKVTFADGTTFETVGVVKTRSWSVPEAGGVVARKVEVRLSGKPKETVA